MLFYPTAKYAQFIHTTQASIVLVGKDFKAEAEIKPTLIQVAIHIRHLLPCSIYIKSSIPEKVGIDAKAGISAGASVGENCYVGDFAYVGENGLHR